jgi:uncharacterized protein YhjY with autotransporter beta-barrel domain
LRCPHCGFWYALDTENWEPNEWHMCRACKRIQARMYQRLRLQDPTFREAEVGRVKRYRAWLRENAPQYVAAYDRERKARQRLAARLKREAEREQKSA